MAEYQFRKAMIGGFNCEDVVEFVTSMAEKHLVEMNEQQEKNQALEEELNQSRELAAQLQDQLDEAARTRDNWAAQAEQAKAALDRSQSEDGEKAQELRQVQAELAGAKQELEQAKAEIARLQAEVERLSPAADAYAAVKERTASIEFEAHRRAQNVESRAKINAGDIMRQAEQWMLKLEEQYGALKAEIETSVAQASQQMAAAGENLTKVSQLMEEQQAALKAVSDACSESVHGKKAE